MGRKPFFVLHCGLLREGPGDEESTRKALSFCRPLPPNPSVADLGCGPGASTLILAKELQAPIVGVDLQVAFLQAMSAKALAAGLSHLVLPKREDFHAPSFAKESLDLLWSEGAIYLLGWEEGLKAWAPLVKPGGFLALTHISWLTENPPQEAKEYWKKNYPQIQSIEKNCEQAKALGLEVIETFALPAKAWWNYYKPLGKRIEAIRPRTSYDEELKHLIQEEELERSMYQKYGDSYGYVFYILKKPSTPPGV